MNEKKLDVYAKEEHRSYILLMRRIPLSRKAEMVFEISDFAMAAKRSLKELHDKERIAKAKEISVNSLAIISNNE